MNIKSLAGYAICLDGRVEAVFEGNKTDVNGVIEWCHVGPPNSRVDDVDVRFEEYSGEFASFTINNNNNY